MKKEKAVESKGAANKNTEEIKEYEQILKTVLKRDAEREKLMIEVLSVLREFNKFLQEIVVNPNNNQQLQQHPIQFPWKILGITSTILSSALIIAIGMVFFIAALG